MPNKVGLCTYFSGGILYYSQTLGFWESPEERQVDVLVTCGPEISGAVKLKDFLAIVAAESDFYARTDKTSSKDFACRALVNNWSLLFKYRQGGEYKRVTLHVLPAGICGVIEAEAKKYETENPQPNDYENLKSRILALPSCILDMSVYRDYLPFQEKFEERLAKDFASRKVWSHYVFPDYVSKNEQPNPEEVKIISGAIRDCVTLEALSKLITGDIGSVLDFISSGSEVQ